MTNKSTTLRTLAIFDEVNQIFTNLKPSSQDQEHQDNKNLIGSQGDHNNNNNNQSSQSQSCSSYSTLTLNKEKTFLKSLIDGNETIAKYLRNSCWKIPIKDVTIQCYIEKKFNSKGQRIWTLYWEFGLFNKIRKFLIAAKKTKIGVRKTSYIFSQDFSDGFNYCGEYYVGTLERGNNAHNNQNIFKLFDNGLNDKQIYDILKDVDEVKAEENNNNGGIITRQKMCSVFISKQKGKKSLNPWKPKPNHIQCSTLVPKLDNNIKHLLYRPDPEGAELLGRSLFSCCSWEHLLHSTDCERLSGELKQICYQGLESLSPQVLLKRRSLDVRGSEAFSLIKLQSSASSSHVKSYQLKFSAPLSVCHAFGIAISLIESGFD